MLSAQMERSSEKPAQVHCLSFLSAQANAAGERKRGHRGERTPSGICLSVKLVCFFVGLSVCRLFACVKKLCIQIIIQYASC